MESNDDNKQQNLSQNENLEGNDRDLTSKPWTDSDWKRGRSKEELEEFKNLRETVTQALSGTNISSNVNSTQALLESQALSKSDTELPKESVDTRMPEKPVAGGDNGQSNQNYIPPMDNPYEKAWKFLYKHDILTLFQVCCQGFFISCLGL